MNRYARAILTFIAFLLLCAAICLVTGCFGSRDEEVPTVHRFAWAKSADGDSPGYMHAYTITDAATGVQYLVVVGSECVDVTPLLDTNGKPVTSADGS